MIGDSQNLEAQPRNCKPLEIDGEVPTETTSVRSIEAAETDQLWLLLISSNSIIRADVDNSITCSWALSITKLVNNVCTCLYI